MTSKKVLDMGLEIFTLGPFSIKVYCVYLVIIKKDYYVQHIMRRIIVL